MNIEVGDVVKLVDLSSWLGTPEIKLGDTGTIVEVFGDGDGNSSGKPTLHEIAAVALHGPPFSNDGGYPIVFAVFRLELVNILDRIVMEV